MKTTALDSVKYGAEAAGVKKSVSKKQWQKIIKYAKSHGYTVAGAVSNNPTRLKERTNSYLMKQAQSIVGKAYDPALKQLDAQGTQLQALSDKRKADNASYQQWLLGKQSEYNAQAAQAQQQYAQYLDTLRQTTESQHQLAQEQGMAAVQGMPATVSDVHQSNALQGLSADTAKATGMVDQARQTSAALLPSMEMRADARQQAIIGQGQAAEAKRQTDLNTGLQSLADNRFKVLTAKAGDIFKTYTDSLNQQVDIANSNRSYEAAAQQLGLKRDELNFSKYQFKQNLMLDLKKFYSSQDIAKAQLQLNYDQLKQTKGENAANRALQKWLAKHATKKNGGAGGMTQGESKAIQGVQTVAGVLGDLHSKHPNGLVGKKTFREYLRAQGFSETQINVAIDYWSHGSKLSAYGRQQAKLLGITHPYNALGKATGSSYDGPG